MHRGRAARSHRTIARIVGLVAILGLAVVSSACATVSQQAADGRHLAVPADGVPPASVTSSTTTTQAPAPAVGATFEPAPNATGVRPDTPVRVVVTNGHLTSLTVTSPDGAVPGTTTDGLFTPTMGLEFGQTYTATATASGLGGSREPTVLRSVFTTLVPEDGTEISADVWPTTGETVGVGTPVIVTFSSPVPADARAALTARFTVTSVPAVEGGWRWLNDTIMHWRPRTYWPGGTAVTLTSNVTGQSAADEWFTSSPTPQTFTIGAHHRITVDALTSTMVAYENGVAVRTMPISTGRDAYPTASGTDLIMEKFSQFEMDSTSAGITGDEAYLVTVGDAQRLTYSGTFIHAAPWNSQLGQANVSHGCINASEEDAAWMMAFTLIGDPVEIGGTSEQVSWGNGWGDWNIAYDSWVGTATD